MDALINVNRGIIPILFLWLILLAASSASSAYVQYASGTSSLPPRYSLKAKGYNKVRSSLLDSTFHQFTIPLSYSAKSKRLGWTVGYYADPDNIPAKKCKNCWKCFNIEVL